MLYQQRLVIVGS